MLPAVLGSVAMDYMQQQAANRERKRQARASIYQQSASSLGAPTYNVQAARVQHGNQLANQNLAASAGSKLASYLGGLPGGGGQAAPSAIERDYMNNPDASTFAGSKVSGPGAPNGQQAQAAPEIQIPEYEVPRLRNPWE